MFERNYSVVNEFKDEKKNGNLKEEITGHLKSLQNDLQDYFPELTNEEATLVQNLFSTSIMQPAFLMKDKEEFLFHENFLTLLWWAMYW